MSFCCLIFVFVADVNVTELLTERCFFYVRVSHVEISYVEISFVEISHVEISHIEISHVKFPQTSF